MMSNTTQPPPLLEPQLAAVLEGIQGQLQLLQHQLGTQYETLTSAISKVQEESTRRLEALETAAPQQPEGLVPGPTPFILTPQGSATPEPEALAGGGSNAATKRKPLPWPEKFKGDRLRYPAWETAMQHKLNRDAGFIGGPEDQFYAIWERLEGTAQKTVEPFFIAGGIANTRNPADFFLVLRNHFLDVNRSKLAGQELRQLKQSPNQKFTTFYATFERTLAEAGGALWPDKAKLTLLEGAVNYKLQKALVTRDVPETYNDWVSMAMTVSTRLDNLERNATGYTGGNRKGAADSDDKQVDQEGDTQMTGVHASSSRAETRKKARAKWATPEERERRRTEGRCLRCGAANCRIARCKYAPAVPPSSTQIKTTSTAGREVADRSEEESGSEN